MIVLLIILLIRTNIIFSVQSVKAHLHYGKNHTKLVGFKELEKYVHLKIRLVLIYNCCNH
jgi:hypothetical protein